MSEKQTAKSALDILKSEKSGFRVLTKREKRNLMLVFGEKNKTLYGQAYDLVKCSREVDFSKVDEIRKALKSIVVCEVKSTKKANAKEDFSGHFFGLTTAELLVSQSLNEQYRFVFVNTVTHKHVEMSISQLLSRAKKIYPVWSITLR